MNNDELYLEDLDPIHRAWRREAEEASLKQATPLEALTEALRWRGFLVDLELNKILPHTLSPESDQKAIKGLLASARPGLVSSKRIQFKRTQGNTGEKEAAHRPSIVRTEASTDSTSSLHLSVKRILDLRFRNHSTGVPQNPITLFDFLNSQVGPSHEAKWLEPPVALLVKTLAIFRCQTVMSCSGHGKTPPTLWFHGPHHLDWFLRVQRSVESSLGLTDVWIPKRSTGWLGWSAELRSSSLEAAVISLHRRACVAFDQQFLVEILKLRGSD
jgi:hypothetical protein